MLSASENETFCRVGPGTPMGNLMRQYWLPVLTSDDLDPDGSPRRVRLLGENLVAFRTATGKVGLMDHMCPHRGASLFYGRNEEEGIRCIYHGWKFDVTGACVDQPGEPEEHNFKSRVAVKAYPCLERNGVIWTYMGTRKTPPPLPCVEANLQQKPPRVDRTLRYCNWLQALEGDIDTVHSEYLHGPAKVDVSTVAPGAGYHSYRNRLRDKLKFAVKETDYGVSYGAYRPAEPGTNYCRIAHFLFPCFTMAPSRAIGACLTMTMWVPADDEHMIKWMLTFPDLGDRSRDPDYYPEYLPDTTDWLGRFRPVPAALNDYLIDRDNQKSVGYSGIRGIPMQDTCVTESMGPIMDRTKEHLGVTDAAIIRTRRRLLEAIRTLEDRGEAPAVDKPELYATRSGWCILPSDVDWWEGSEELRRGFSELRGESAAVTVLREPLIRR